jgi:hypothetical protein
MKVPFGQEWKDKNSIFDFPKLKLDNGEKARIVIIDPEPECEYVHSLRKVITDDQGRPLMEEKKRRDDSTYEVPQTEFKGKFICLGDPETLFEKNIDPDNCPACKAATENSSAVARPEPRFVLNVLKYNLKKGTTNPNVPFQVELFAWEFSLGRMKALRDISEEHGNLNQVDLLLGPVEGPLMFQKFPINAAKTCEAWKSDSNKQTAFAVITNNKEDDLTPILGRKVTFAELQGQVYELIAAYNNAFGIPGSLPQAPAKPPKEEPAVDISAMINGGGAVGEEDVEEDDATDEDSDEAPETEDLQALLAKLG